MIYVTEVIYVMNFLLRSQAQWVSYILLMDQRHLFLKFNGLEKCFTYYVK